MACIDLDMDTVITWPVCGLQKWFLSNFEKDMSTFNPSYVCKESCAYPNNISDNNDGLSKPLNNILVCTTSKNNDISNTNY